MSNEGQRQQRQGRGGDLGDGGPCGCRSASELPLSRQAGSEAQPGRGDGQKPLGCGTRIVGPEPACGNTTCRLPDAREEGEREAEDPGRGMLTGRQGGEAR